MDPDDNWTRGVVGHSLAARGEEPEGVAAILNANLGLPKPSLADMRGTYAKEKGLSEDRKAMVGIDCTFGRLKDALGKPPKCLTSDRLHSALAQVRPDGVARQASTP